MYKDESQVKEDMLTSIDNGLDKSKNSFIHDAVSGTALKIASFNMQLEYVANKLNFENLADEEVDQYIYPRTGIKRKPAVKATGVVSIKGEEGTAVEKGILVSAGTIDYETIEEKTIGADGEVDVAIRALVAGTSGNVPGGAIAEFPVAVSSLLSVINKEPITNGYDQESDEDYKNRHLERMRTPVTNGNKYHYLLWAKGVPGVGAARVVPLWAGDNTVKVIIINSNGEPADSDLVEEVQEHIDPGGRGLGKGEAPFGAFTTVVSAKAKEITVKVKIVIGQGREPAEVQKKIEKNIKEHLKNMAFKESMVGYAYIGAIILNTNGVVDYAELTINGGASNVQVADDEVAILTGVDLID